MRLSTRLGILAATAGLGALIGMTPVQPAYAQFGISIGGFPVGIHFGGRYRAEAADTAGVTDAAVVARKPRIRVRARLIR
jgi:hypothetical protein